MDGFTSSLPTQLASTHIGHFLSHPLSVRLPSPSNISITLLYTATALLTALVSVCLYRVYFHPLSRYPGPLLSKITPLHATWHAYKGDRHLFLHRLHMKYGPVVRWAPNAVSINTATALKEVYGHGLNARNVRKSDFYKAFPAVKGVHNTHNSIDKAEHARKRRVLSQAFSENALKGLEGLMLKNINVFFEKLDERMAKGKVGEDLYAGKGGRKGLDMGEMFSWLTFDVLGELCFGKAFGMLVDSSQRFVERLIDNAAHNHHICGHYLPLSTLGLSKLLFPTIAGERWRFILHSRACANERMELHKSGQDADKRDFFHYLLQAVDPETGKGFETVELWGEANVLMIAGSDTTSTALAATLYYLTKNPEKLKKIQEEVRGKFDRIEDIVSGKELTDCVYLRACIEEGLRMCPPVPGLLPREVIAPAGLTIDCSKDGPVEKGFGKYYFPQGTVLGVNIYSIHHHPEYYPEPYKYTPERWLLPHEDPRGEGQGTEESTEKARAAFTPFSIGSRGCIGKSLAMMEMRLVLGRMMWGWDVEGVEGVEGKSECWRGGYRWEGEGGIEEEYRIFDHFTARKEGPVIEFKRRIVE
ncbi:cytochrome P450 [Kalaharituber pfeilii]|nr:cytochrome P450 [Kalaharituber pfeilii]